MRPILIFLVVALAAPAAAQDARTLEDMRRDMAALAVELAHLKRELSATTGAESSAGGSPSPAGGDLLRRVDQVEAELALLTSQAERMSFRIDNIVSDGTTRLGDLEFRVCEIDPVCDTATLPRTSVLGAGHLPEFPAPPPGGPAWSDQPQLAIGESRDYERAKAALENDDADGVVRLLEDFENKYPVSPILSEALFLRGEAHARRADWKNAARAYLEAFSDQPEGPVAADSLLGLGGALAELGQTDEACVMLSELELRFPEHPAREEVADTMLRLNCL